MKNIWKFEKWGVVLCSQTKNRMLTLLSIYEDLLVLCGAGFVVFFLGSIVMFVCGDGSKKYSPYNTINKRRK